MSISSTHKTIFLFFLLFLGFIDFCSAQSIPKTPGSTDLTSYIKVCNEFSDSAMQKECLSTVRYLFTGGIIVVIIIAGLVFTRVQPFSVNDVVKPQIPIVVAILIAIALILIFLRVKPFELSDILKHLDIPAKQM